MAPNSHTYLDYYQTADRANEPHAIGGFLPIDSVYTFDPVPAELEDRYRDHILGAQVQLWTEYIPTPSKAEYMAYPRTSALAEVVWTPVARKDFADFTRRMEVHRRRLDAMDVNYRR
jgi:hexosaminidase